MDQSRFDGGADGQSQPPAPLPASPSADRSQLGSRTAAYAPPPYPSPGSPPLVEPRSPAEWSASVPRSKPKRGRPVLWIALAALFLVSTGAMAYLYIDTTGQRNDTKETLASTRNELKAAKEHGVKLESQLAETSGKLTQTQGELKDSRSEATDLQRDLKTAQVCLKGIMDIGKAGSTQQMAQIFLRVNDECRSAYRTVQDNLPG